MASLWDEGEAGAWPWTAQIQLMADATYLARLDRRQEPHKAQLALARAAQCLLHAINEFPGEAARLWAGKAVITDAGKLDPASMIAAIKETALDDLIDRLNAFTELADREVKAIQRVLDRMPQPSSRGPANPHQVGFRMALDTALARLPGVKLTREQSDRIVGLIASVVFGKDIDAETVARTRQRQRKRQRARQLDNLG